MTVYDKIKGILKERKLSIKQLSAMSGISYNTLYAAIRRKQDTITMENAIKISEALNIPLHEITTDGSIIDKYRDEIEYLRKENKELKSTIKTLLTLIKGGD